MYHNGQIVWNSKHKKPEIQDNLTLGPDTYLSEYFGSCFPKYVQRHFVKVDATPNDKGYIPAFCPESIEQAQELLDQGIIKPAEMPDSHTQCCGKWDDGRPHAFWCENGKRESKHDVIEHHETEKLKAYWNKRVTQAKRAYAIQLYRNAKKYIELVQSLGPTEYGYEPTLEDLQFCGKLHGLLDSIPRIEKIEKWDADYDEESEDEEDEE